MRTTNKNDDDDDDDDDDDMAHVSSLSSEWFGSRRPAKLTVGVPEMGMVREYKIYKKV